MSDKPQRAHVLFDGMTWPLPTGSAQAETRWALTHGQPTRQQMLLAASVMAAYQQMVFDPETKRRSVIRALRRASLSPEEASKASALQRPPSSEIGAAMTEQGKAPAAGSLDDRWWCWECHGLGEWEDGYDECSPYDVECPCCGGDGWHDGDDRPACVPKDEPQASASKTPENAVEIPAIPDSKG